PRLCPSCPTRRSSDLVWGAVRGAAQLIAIGYVLLLLFSYERPLWVLVLLGVMLVAAGATAARRVEHGPPRRVLFPRAIAAVGAGDRKSTRLNSSHRTT